MLNFELINWRNKQADSSVLSGGFTEAKACPGRATSQRTVPRVTDGAAVSVAQARQMAAELRACEREQKLRCVLAASGWQTGSACLLLAG
jgi:hypothetical protein